MATNIFQKVPLPKVRRSYFNNSHEVKFNCDMGQIIPFLCKIMNPSEFWKIGNEIVVRCPPLAAPLLHQIDVQTYYFVASGESSESVISSGSLSEMTPVSRQNSPI